jgi:hypothetical protein
MGYERLAYDDQDTTHQMHDDCLVCSSHMRVPHDAIVPEPVELSVPAQRTQIEVTEAAADLASRLHLHLD